MLKKEMLCNLFRNFVQACLSSLKSENIKKEDAPSDLLENIFVFVFVGIGRDQLVLALLWQMELFCICIEPMKDSVRNIFIFDLSWNF